MMQEQEQQTTSNSVVRRIVLDLGDVVFRRNITEEDLKLLLSSLNKNQTTWIDVFDKNGDLVWVQTKFIKFIRLKKI